MEFTYSTADGRLTSLDLLVISGVWALALVGLAAWRTRSCGRQGRHPPYSEVAVASILTALSPFLLDAAFPWVVDILWPSTYYGRHPLLDPISFLVSSAAAAVIYLLYRSGFNARQK